MCQISLICLITSSVLGDWNKSLIHVIPLVCTTIKQKGQMCKMIQKMSAERYCNNLFTISRQVRIEHGAAIPDVLGALIVLGRPRRALSLAKILGGRYSSDLYWSNAFSGILDKACVVVHICVVLNTLITRGITHL